MVVLGIDPGVEGGLALLSANAIVLKPMPQAKDGGVDTAALLRLLAGWAPRVTHCAIEQASIRPQQAGQFKIGRNFGILEGFLIATKIPYEVIRPQAWSDAFPHGVTETDKKERYRLIKLSRRKLVQGLFPGLDLRKSKRAEIPHEGLVDATLIALYWWDQKAGVR